MTDSCRRGPLFDATPDHRSRSAVMHSPMRATTSGWATPPAHCSSCSRISNATTLARDDCTAILKSQEGATVPGGGCSLSAPAGSHTRARRGHTPESCERRAASTACIPCWTVPGAPCMSACLRRFVRHCCTAAISSFVASPRKKASTFSGRLLHRPRRSRRAFTPTPGHRFARPRRSA